jgi:hypothetical protein
MLTRTLRNIALTTALVMAWAVYVGYSTEPAGGAARGALQGLVLSVAMAIGIVIQTLAGRDRFSCGYSAATQPDSVERQVFVAAASGAFVDMMATALVSAAFVIVYPDLVPAAALLIGIVVVSLVDFGIRYGLHRHSLVGAN